MFFKYNKNVFIIFAQEIPFHEVSRLFRRGCACEHDCYIKQIILCAIIYATLIFSLYGGQPEYGYKKYIDYITVDLPIMIAATHGGRIKGKSITECESGLIKLVLLSMTLSSMLIMVQRPNKKVGVHVFS